MLKYTKLEQNEEIPYDILLLGDPSVEMIENYLDRGICYTVSLEGKMIGAYVLLNTRLFTWEIVNICLVESFRGNGYGKQILMDAIKRARAFGARFVEIGTGNSSFNQMALYQKCGFRVTAVVPDFFLKNYKEPIFENDIRVCDMVRLGIDFNL